MIFTWSHGDDSTQTLGLLLLVSEVSFISSSSFDVDKNNTTHGLMLVLLVQI